MTDILNQHNRQKKLFDDILKASSYINSNYGKPQPIIMMGKNKSEHDINYNRLLFFLIKVLEAN